MYVSAIKHLFVIEKLSLIGFTCFGFVQTIIHDFKHTIIELIVTLSSTNAKKTIVLLYVLCPGFELL